MKTSKKFSTITSYQNHYFTEWFGDMEFNDAQKSSRLFSKKLPRDMNDAEILAELKPTEVSLEEVYHALETADHSDWRLFYVKDKDEVLRAVFVRWYDDGWVVSALSVGDPRRWLGGPQVFSRNCFETVSLSPDPKTLKTSDPSDLEQRVVELEQFKAKVEKVLILE